MLPNAFIFFQSVKYLMSTCYIPGTVLGAGNIAVNKTILALGKFTF